MVWERWFFTGNVQQVDHPTAYYTFNPSFQELREQRKDSVIR